MPNIERLAVDEAVAELLRKALRLDGFFPEFGPEQAEKIFARGGLFLYPEGAPVVQQKEEGRDLFVLQSGRLAVFRWFCDELRRVATLQDGDIFGEIGLLCEGVRVATVVAEVPSRIFRVAYGDIQYLLKHNQELGAHLQSLLQQRL